MSVVQLDSESVVAHIVESMLPRFSDSKLGLLIEIDMGITDFGYGEDGGTVEREALSIRRSLCFLFVRPSNYTKVLFWEPKEDAKGLGCSPFYSNVVQEWHLESDHDSCWRDGFGSKVAQAYFDACDKFKGRIRTGKELRPCDLSQFITFWRDPSYMYLETCEQKDKAADRFGNEGRIWNVKMHPITLAQLEVVQPRSGLLIKGSEDHQHCLKYKGT